MTITTVPPALTFRTATARLRPLGINLRRTADTREYRVNFRNGLEATAYYATCLEDAVASGVMMADHRRQQAKGVAA